jgi:hypothetical protein
MAAKHIAKRNRFAPMFCNSKNGANPVSVLLLHNLRFLRHNRSGCCPYALSGHAQKELGNYL